MNDQNKLSVAARYAKWYSRNTFGNSPRGNKITAVLYLMFAVFSFSRHYDIAIGYFLLIGAFISFLNAGYIELLNKK